jgi:hypothetical protein
MQSPILPKEPPLSSIPYVCAALHTVLTTVANTAARSTGFIRRQRTLTGASFVQALVFGFLAKSAASLDQLAQAAAAAGAPISPQGLDQRFTPQAAACLQTVLGAAAQQVVAADPVAIPLLQRFNGIYVLDSTVIMLPDALEGEWRGNGGSTVVGTSAALKVQVLWNLTCGSLHHVGLQAGRANDNAAPVQAVTLPAGALRIADLGYFSVPRIASLSAQQVFVLSRLNTQVALFDEQGQRLDLLDVLEQSGAAQDLPVQMGAKHGVRVRLLAVRVPQEVADQRRRRLREEARAKGKAPSERLLALAAWTTAVTTVPGEQLSLEEALVLLRARWQIELLFKLWKSHGQVDEWRSAQPWRILCEVYAKLLAMIVQHWVLLVGCWHQPNRSLVKAAQTVQGYALALLSALGKSAERVAEVLVEIQRSLERAGRLNRRKKKPSTYQLLLDAPTGALT